MKLSSFFMLSCLAVIVSCNSAETDQQDKKSNSMHNTIESKIVSSDTLQTTSARGAYAEIIKIDYQKNKDILDILPLLPDSAMRTWDWSKEEREGMVRSLAASNQFTDTTKDYNTILKLTPNYFETGVVDGSWTAALYRVSENHYIVVTNDITGDWNEINAYEVEGQQITAVSWDQMIGKKPGDFLLKNHSKPCKDVLYEDEEGNQEIGMFYYDFSDPNLLSVSCYYVKKANSNCFHGNEVILKFNKDSKRFDSLKTNWKNFKQ